MNAIVVTRSGGLCFGPGELIVLFAVTAVEAFGVIFW